MVHFEVPNRVSVEVSSWGAAATQTRTMNRSPAAKKPARLTCKASAAAAISPWSRHQETHCSTTSPLCMHVSKDFCQQEGKHVRKYFDDQRVLLLGGVYVGSLQNSVELKNDAEWINTCDVFFLVVSWLFNDSFLYVKSERNRSMFRNFRRFHKICCCFC